MAYHTLTNESILAEGKPISCEAGLVNDILSHWIPMENGRCT